VNGKASHALALAVSVLFAAPGLAHDTWVRARGAATVGKALVLDLTSGMAFPALETAIAPERVARAGLRVGGRTSVVVPRRRARASLELVATPEALGLAVVWVVLHPRTLSLTPEDVRSYLDEIGAPDVVRERWRASGGKSWRERYVKHAKTFFATGSPASDPSWREPVGLTLEIVPESDPGALHAGDTLRVRVLRSGVGLAGFALGVAPADGKASLVTTDAEGRASLILDRPGPLLLRGTELRPSREAGLDWESDFTTLTLEVALR